MPDPDPMVPRRYRVRRKRRETHDVVTLELEPQEGASAPFAAGQFNMVYAFGRGEIPLSISGDPSRGGPIVHTIRDVGPVSRALCAARRGETVGLRGPFGSGWDVPSAEGRDVVVVAGGMGLAPLRPAIYQLLAERDRYGRVVVLFGARSPADVLFRSELESWRGRFDLHVDVTVDAAPSSWRGHVGVVTRLLPRAPFDAADAVALVCGPEVMMRFAAAALVDQGVAAERIRISMERNMRCGVALCGHCQLGPLVVCRDGPVVTYDRVSELVGVREL